MDASPHGEPLIGVVGPCGAGKSTLVGALQALGFRCRHIAQEHSYVPYMWQRISQPDILIFLNATFVTCTARRRLNWSETDYQEQLRRLEHARAHADLTIETDDLAPGEVLAKARVFLLRRGLKSA
jgi:ABC-type Mn2+/Zn2+ transport system ATPase subunit